MAIDKIILLNHKIVSPPAQIVEYIQNDFSNYLEIYDLLLKNKIPTKHLHIYDITHNPSYPNNTIFLINDHINRIGENPFIGKQFFFNIDFINMENLYTQNTQGVITTCYGQRYKSSKMTTEFPSTHIANIAALAHISEYIISGYLINQT